MGNGISAGLEIISVIIIGMTWLLLRHRNNKKDKIIGERATTNGLEGDKALNFGYIL